jgi:GAF domain-containing protein
MALLAVGIMYLPTSYLTPPSPAPVPTRRTVTLDSANRQIGFAIANALEQHNRSQAPSAQAAALSQEEKNRALLDAYGERSSLEDMERAFEMMSLGEAREGRMDPQERNRRLLEAYGEKTSLRDLERAMEIYEVQ